TQGQNDTVTITNPSNGATVSGTVNVTTSTTGAIDEVKFYIDGSLVKDDTSSPFDYSWDTTAYPDDTYTITADGYVSGTLKDSDSVTVTVQNEQPSSWVEITAPLDGQTVSGRRVTIRADASTDITKVEFYIDGSLKRTDTSRPFSYRWNTTSYSNGNHTITVKGYAGSVYKAEDSITVIVSNGSIALLSWLILFLPVGIYYKTH
ncbi:MAG: Ig-like domain-containing protein, partial [Theionarchaea archaeon]|nr:Ig-like domain-containing protein [Theionarchaea archaeon]